MPGKAAKNSQSVKFTIEKIECGITSAGLFFLPGYTSGIFILLKVFYERRPLRYLVVTDGVFIKIM